ncbi:K+/H+ antiporter [Tyzzerella sp. An114]|uniref:potassium/proton antiporter n=1 Tax=Tyzzerella sp. An114 TaxID=1965545 RepID=UPI000B4499AB|nr:potassium/proton antiporter [Tyzzerella sp. An114]OUQ60524.1 K+/H+ antiporter [Tyzzerella sp. An114]HIT72281.1 potassium/proton antiporter [Candidatus Fimicola cottocaccae]
MIMGILLFASVILLCIGATRFSDKFGMPALLLFMMLGMIFGSDGIFKISFSDYTLTENVCSFVLIFIMFYGGFCTKWSVAKPVVKKAVALSTIGVLLTVMGTAVFCKFVLNVEWKESFLIGSVLGSTDAASVFSILRSKKLSLKEGSSSILEIESGSNDPFAYMLTVIAISLMNSGENVSVISVVFSQIAYGVVIGVAAAILAVKSLRKLNFSADGLDTIFIIAVALISYSVPSLIGGNGYLSVYITGIIMGNSPINNKKGIIHFFDSITGISQIILFFILGLLSFPHKMGTVIIPALLISISMIFVVRPIVVFLILKIFKCSTKQCLLISWAGIRGAASIVFSIMALVSGISMKYDIFHIVFVVSLISVSFQGALLPKVAKTLSMVDYDEDVGKTFNDYQEEAEMTLMKMYIPKGHNWENRKIEDVSMPYGSLAIMIKRGEENIIPKGDTIIYAGDSIILNVPYYTETSDVFLKEIIVDKTSKWKDRKISEIDFSDNNTLIALIKRGNENIIPSGKTVIHEGDKVIFYS